MAAKSKVNAAGKITKKDILIAKGVIGKKK